MCAHPQHTNSTLAGQWQALLAVAIEMARSILHLESRQPRKALEKTEMLEAWCLLAVTELSQQITAEGPEANARKPFREQLPPVYMILQMFLVFTQRVKAGLKAKLIEERLIDKPAAHPVKIAARAEPYPFWDTS